MKIEEAFKQIEKLYESINSIHPELSYEIVKTPEGPFKSWFREEVPALGYSKKSGVYLFSNSEHVIYYIGKAASDNLGAEIYSKFGTATIVDKRDDVPQFNNSMMAAEMFRQGDIYISVFHVVPKEFCSLFEVYLHVWCLINGGLPDENKRIG